LQQVVTFPAHSPPAPTTSWPEHQFVPIFLLGLAKVEAVDGMLVSSSHAKSVRNVGPVKYVAVRE